MSLHNYADTSNPLQQQYQYRKTTNIKIQINGNIGATYYVLEVILRGTYVRTLLHVLHNALIVMLSLHYFWQHLQVNVGSLRKKPILPPDSQLLYYNTQSNHLGQVWYLIVSIPDLCTLTYF